MLHRCTSHIIRSKLLRLLIGSSHFLYSEAFVITKGFTDGDFSLRFRGKGTSLHVIVRQKRVISPLSRKQVYNFVRFFYNSIQKTTFFVHPFYTIVQKTHSVLHTYSWIFIDLREWTHGNTSFFMLLHRNTSNCIGYDGIRTGVNCHVYRSIGDYTAPSQSLFCRWYGTMHILPQRKPFQVP